MFNFALGAFIGSIVMATLYSINPVEHNRPEFSKLIYKSEHDVTVVSKDRICLVYQRFNDISFQDDVVVCEVIE